MGLFFLWLFVMKLWDSLSKALIKRSTEIELERKDKMRADKLNACLRAHIAKLEKNRDAVEQLLVGKLAKNQRADLNMTLAKINEQIIEMHRQIRD